MSKKEFSRESVDKIYDAAKEIGYKDGYDDGYIQCKIDIIEHLGGKYEQDVTTSR